MNETRHLLISGTVQGVFYRQSFSEQATAMGVQGWCRNLADGRVEAIIHAAIPQLEALIAWAHAGPPEARVTEVHITHVNVPPQEVVAMRMFAVRPDGISPCIA
ncbi:MAG: acylphosphatase [Candidatus Melainabacteria bacterium]